MCCSQSSKRMLVPLLSQQRRLHQQLPRLHRLMPQQTVQVQWSLLCHLPNRKLRPRKLLPESLPCWLMVIQQRLLQNLPHSVHHQRRLR
jgi:hypothetical protein